MTSLRLSRCRFFEMVSALCVIQNARYYGLSAPCGPPRPRICRHQQSQRINEDGFSRAGFAGEQVEPRAERGDGVIDDA